MTEAEFTRPDFTRPIDVEARLAATPDQATIKGLMFKPLMRSVEEKTGATIGRGHYATFSDYPVREFMQVLVDTAGVVHPDLPLGEALRQLARPVYPNLKSNAAGTFIFALAGGDLMGSVRLVNKVYNLLTTASATSTVLDDRNAVVQLRGAHAFPEVYQPGVYEGALAVFGRQGEIRVRTLEPGALDIRIELA